MSQFQAKESFPTQNEPTLSTDDSKEVHKIRLQIPSVKFILSTMARVQKAQVHVIRGRIMVRGDTQARHFKKDLKKILSTHEWRNLKEMKIHCERVSDLSIKQIGSEIAKHLSYLHILDLRLVSCFNMTDKGAEIMGQSIARNFSHLQELRLNFIECYHITNQGLKLLGSEIAQHLTHLQALDLKFANCYQVNNQGLQSLGHNITRYLTHLHTLSFDFSDCEAITNTGVWMLACEIAQNLVRLKHLDLIFYVLSESMENQLRDLLSYIPSVNLSP